MTTRNTPFDAYRYARGEKVGLPPFVDTRKVKGSDAQPATGGVSAHPYCLPPDTCQYTATRVIQLPKGRALDFAAITDHSEWLGEANICFFESNVSCQSTSDCSTGQTCDKPPEGKAAPAFPKAIRASSASWRGSRSTGWKPDEDVDAAGQSQRRIALP